MKKPGEFTVRDYIFRETVSCPLKLKFIRQENYNDQRDDLFRRKSKRVLRESVAQLFENIRFTSDDTSIALTETNRWMQEDVVSICGAVVRTGHLRARLPILQKNGRHITIIQIHGKVVKGDPSAIFDRSPIGRSLNRYLLKSAYRYHVVTQLYPEADVSCKFIFPRKSFKSGENHLFEKTQGINPISDVARKELRNLFAQVDGTLAVEKVLNHIPADVSHSWFTGDSIPEAIGKLRVLNNSDVAEKVDHVHLGCRSCRFRVPEKLHEKGCWDLHFSDPSVKNSDKHLFELIGHHVQKEHLVTEKYQENVSHSESFSSAEKVIAHTDKKIAIYHRKAMQLLEAKDRRLPLLFAKNMIGKIRELSFPLHFIDFEAATHPVPFREGARPYDPLLFQFSCHTLENDGSTTHTQWLDQNKQSNPHMDIVNQLAEIPDLQTGTIVQFSPFEKQALFKLYHQMKEMGQSAETQYLFLKKVLNVDRADRGDRFLDLSILLKDGYYNRFMNDGLSLKSILYAVLQAEEKLRTLKEHVFCIEGASVDLFKKENERVIDPYSQISDKRSRINDGITAMHAYLCLKAGVLNEEQQQLVPMMLKRYCTMDSLGLLLIYKHLYNLMEMGTGDGDLIIEE